LIRTPIIIIINPLQSTAGQKLLQLLVISLNLRLLASSSCQPPCANRLSTIGVLHTFTETLSPLQNSFTPAVVGSTADMASPLPLWHANTVCYVGDQTRHKKQIKKTISEHNVICANARTAQSAARQAVQNRHFFCIFSTLITSP
jgi:hypothetical protein